MRRLSVVVFLVCLGLLWANEAMANQKWNPYTNKWETVPDNYEIKYDLYNGGYSFHAPRARKVYNPWSGRYDWSDGRGNQRQRGNWVGLYDENGGWE